MDTTQALKDRLDKAFATSWGESKPILGGALNIAKNIPAAPVRLGASLYDLPSQVRGNQPMQPFTVPGLGQQKTYARQFVDETPTKGAWSAGIGAASQGILDAAATGQLAQSGADIAQAGYQRVQGMSPLARQSGGIQLFGENVQPPIHHSNVFPTIPSLDKIHPTVAPNPTSVEHIIENQGGWKPGLRQVFDTALIHKDKAAVEQLLPQVPIDYLVHLKQVIQTILKQ